MLAQKCTVPGIWQDGCQMAASSIWAECDHQVKIRGYRIELGEIETQLTKVEAVQEAIVLACEDGGGEKHALRVLL